MLSSHTQTGKRLLSFFIGVLFLFPFVANPAFAALDNKGNEFLIPFLPNASGVATVLQLHLTSEVVTTVDIQYPVNAPSFITSVNVVPGDITVVNLPASVDNWSTNAVSNNTVRATSNDEFVAYSVNLYPQSSDAALALPVDTMNTDYIVMSYPSTFSSYGYNSHFIVYAAYDNTDVTITQSISAYGRTAGVPYTVSLNRGEAFYIQGASNGTNGDLSGTIVESTRPVGLVNGNGCTQVPNGTTACDAIYEIAQPTQTWGKSVLTANLPNRAAGSTYRVFASADGTQVSLDGGALGSINRGDYIETGVIPGDHLFEGNQPIYVVQYMTGQDYPGVTRTGDPAMGNMIPAEQYLYDYTFSTVGGNQFASQFLTVIAQDSDVGFVLLDGVAIPGASFSAIGSTGFSSAVIPLTQGAHTTSSPSSSTFGHGITVEGYNPYDSFIYPGGALFGFIDPTGDPYDPVCSFNQATGTGLATDNHPSEDTNGNDALDPGEDINGNGIIDADTGIFFVELSASTNTALTVDPFIPADGSVGFSVALVDDTQGGTATVTATDGAGNTCSVDIEFGGSVQPPCDLDADGDVDKDDISIIAAARNTPAAGNEALDIDHDGTITLNDARMCVVECTRNRCATQ